MRCGCGSMLSGPLTCRRKNRNIRRLHRQSFDFTPWNDDKLLLLFAQAADEGRKYPTKKKSLKFAGFNLDLNLHVRTYARQLL